MGSSRAVELGRIHRLDNPVQHYPWGSRTAIPELLGEPVPAAQPWAELWMGAHAVASSRVMAAPDASEPLDAFIARDPEAVLGKAVAARFGGRLPFLLKVLAVAEPLSIQVHPSLARAREGFARENRRGLRLDAPDRCYRDANHKPELICALTRFHALSRFRDPRDIAGRFAALHEPILARPVEALCERADRDGLADFFTALWRLAEPARRTAIERAAAWARGKATADAAARWVTALAQRHPGDVGVLSPLLLNVVELAPGEAMFVPPGEIHSYLEGVGIEIMANSDNVVRGGLTAKHVDVPELLRTLAFRVGDVERLRPSAVGPGERRYQTPAEEFALSVLEIHPDAPWHAPAERNIEILLCTAGCGRLIEGEAHAVARGSCFIVPAAASGYSVDGDLTLYRASPGI